jgi:16S rRNA A1518/A1519 N6-dimethyltransferase RsmA/KsgA/DIM1 with predicted DNA glycosylase/AP lyase activity
LKNGLGEGPRGILTDARIHEALALLGIRADARAEQLSIAQFAALFAELLPG